MEPRYPTRTAEQHMPDSSQGPRCGEMVGLRNHCRTVITVSRPLVAASVRPTGSPLSRNPDRQAIGATRESRFLRFRQRRPLSIGVARIAPLSGSRRTSFAGTSADSRKPYCSTCALACSIPGASISTLHTQTHLHVRVLKQLLSPTQTFTPLPAWVAAGYHLTCRAILPERIAQTPEPVGPAPDRSRSSSFMTERPPSKKDYSPTWPFRQSACPGSGRVWKQPTIMVTWSAPPPTTPDVGNDLTAWHPASAHIRKRKRHQPT